MCTVKWTSANFWNIDRYFLKFFIFFEIYSMYSRLLNLADIQSILAIRLYASVKKLIFFLVDHFPIYLSHVLSATKFSRYTIHTSHLSVCFGKKIDFFLVDHFPIYLLHVLSATKFSRYTINTSHLSIRIDKIIAWSFPYFPFLS